MGVEDTLRLPPAGERIGTGPIQFGNDWTGIFMRGDDAIGLAAMLVGMMRQEVRADEMWERVLLLTSCIEDETHRANVRARLKERLIR